jgi:hypothetical protein
MRSTLTYIVIALLFTNHSLAIQVKGFDSVIATKSGIPTVVQANKDCDNLVTTTTTTTTTPPACDTTAATTGVTSSAAVNSLIGSSPVHSSTSSSSSSAPAETSTRTKHLGRSHLSGRATTADSTEHGSASSGAEHGSASSGAEHGSGRTATAAGSTEHGRSHNSD